MGEMEWASDYWTLGNLSHLYLEDSYVLGIQESPGRLVFRMEFVLQETHPEYEVPGPEVQYCYRRGELVFESVSDISWSRRGSVPAVDATGEIDLGNIDALLNKEGRFRLFGDWSDVRVRSAAPHIRLTSKRSGGG